jgi:hypothetical protein
MNISMIFSLSRYFLISTALVVSFKSYAADNPVGTTLTLTLTGSSPLTNEGTITVNNYGISGSGVITNSGTIDVSGANNHGISAAPGSNVTNSGSIYTNGGASAGIVIWGIGNDVSTITNTSTGVVFAGSSSSKGVELQGNTILNNAGVIFGDSSGLEIYFATDVSITNTGSIIGGNLGGNFNLGLIFFSSLFI